VLLFLLVEFCFLLRTSCSQIHFFLWSFGHARVLPATAARLFPGLRTSGSGQKLLPAMVAAKVERLSIAFGVESGCLVHGHSADGVFGRGFRIIHCFVSFLVAITALWISWLHCFRPSIAVIPPDMDFGEKSPCIPTTRRHRKG
jgi:hypothetical protein